MVGRINGFNNIKDLQKKLMQLFINADLEAQIKYYLAYPCSGIIKSYHV